MRLRNSVSAAVISVVSVGALVSTPAYGLSAAPSGAVAARVKWGKPVKVENFNGTKLNKKRWNIYKDLRPGHTKRTASSVSVRGGHLRLTGHVEAVAGDVSGGIGDRYGQKYGKWSVRFRADKGNGYGAVVLLWPFNENWPDEGEIDMAEVFDGKRRSASVFLHYGPDNHQSANHSIKADFSKWHVISVEWLRDHIRFYIDGRLHWSVTRNRNPAKNLVPSTKFRLALQMDAGCTGYCKRDSTTPRRVAMEIDWVRIYKAPAGAR